MGSERRQKNCKYWNLHAVVMSDCSLIAARNSHAKHNQLVGRIPRIHEHRQKRVAHQRHGMGSERRQTNSKYWNLRPVVISDCSLIATRKSHAKHKKSVGRIPCGSEHQQIRVAHQRHEISSERRSKKSQILELTICSHVGVFIDSHPKFTCQTQEISGSHTSRRWDLWNWRGCERRHRRVDNEGTNYGWEEGKTFTNIGVRGLFNQNPKYVKYEGERGAAHTMDYGWWRFRRTKGSSSPLKYRQ